ncbi:hypothetical protein B0H14DRAFT_3440354 [Mycena olivaceomarginata]|nr:hypothetical protein B0H14DRAFT_3440354 [Mycena olivaceomarginata]
MGLPAPLLCRAFHANAAPSRTTASASPAPAPPPASAPPRPSHPASPLRCLDSAPVLSPRRCPLAVPCAARPVPSHPTPAASGASPPCARPVLSPRCRRSLFPFHPTSHTPPAPLPASTAGVDVPTSQLPRPVSAHARPAPRTSHTHTHLATAPCSACPSRPALPAHPFRLMSTPLPHPHPMRCRAHPVLPPPAEGGGAEADTVKVARDALFNAVAQVAELWSADAEVGQALSELFKAITALPADLTLLSLPAGPLLGVLCRAAGRRVNGVWLALAAILETEACVRQVAGALVTAALGVLGAPGGMVEVCLVSVFRSRFDDLTKMGTEPDIVQEFFARMDRVAAAFCTLPDGPFDALIQCVISALALQKRYSLVAACTFLGTFIHRIAPYAPLSAGELQLLQAHMIRAHGRAIMRAVLCGFAGAAPRSVSANLLELPSLLVSRGDQRAVAEAEGEMRATETARNGGGARGWGRDSVFAGLYPVEAGHANKERFVKTVVSSRSVKKTKEAANQFMMVAWGMEGSRFGYSSAS